MTELLNLFEQKVLFFVIIQGIFLSNENIGLTAYCSFF